MCENAPKHVKTCPLNRPWRWCYPVVRWWPPHWSDSLELAELYLWCRWSTTPSPTPTPPPTTTPTTPTPPVWEHDEHQEPRPASIHPALLLRLPGNNKVGLLKTWHSCMIRLCLFVCVILLFWSNERRNGRMTLRRSVMKKWRKRWRRCWTSH